MKNLTLVSVSSVFSMVLLPLAGCEAERPAPSPPVRNPVAEVEQFQEYYPTRAAFLPLTEITPADQPGKTDTIVAYITLADSAASAVKAPATFRFEIFQFKPLSLDPRGKRLYIWDDINLTAFNDNNRYWRDYLRAYEFTLAYDCDAATKYVLEATCLHPSGTRLVAQTILQKK